MILRNFNSFLSNIFSLKFLSYHYVSKFRINISANKFVKLSEKSTALSKMKSSFIALFLTVYAVTSWSQQPAPESDPLMAFFDYKNFYAPEQGNYIETYLSFAGHTIEYVKNANGNPQGEVQVTQIIKQHDSIIDFKKYNLKSPIIKNDSLILDFVDQKRWKLKPGLYNYDLIITDLNNKENPAIKNSQVLEVHTISKNKLETSDVELLQSFKKSDVFTEWSKSGYEVIPYVSNYFPPSVGKLVYYMEIYGSERALGAENRYIVNQYIEKASTSTRFDNYSRFSKMSTEKVNVVFNSFDIEELPSGSYNLVIEIRDKSNKIVETKRLFFDRLNPVANPDIASLADIDYSNSFAANFISEDSISEAIKCLSPIANDIENSVIQMKLEALEFETKKQFFYNFWTQRYPDAEEKWNEYLEQVRQVDRLFGTTVKEGYVTDRGRIYLKYGAPNTLTDRPHEPSSYPYQVWHYYKLGQFSNRKFIFYLPDLVTNDYEILHSDMRGERQNYRWQIDLQKRTSPFGNLDQTTPANSSHGSRSNDIFNNPR
ncbi:MAG: GWxTD domain-containing protein [Parvicellaceae bacterium]|jgi:GWxTD domain-containing protein